MARVSKKQSSDSTQSDPGALICAPGLLFDAATVGAQIATGIENAKDNFERRTAISSALNTANSAARGAIKTAYQATPFETGGTIRA